MTTTTYARINYRTPSGRPTWVMYRWGDRWQAKVQHLESLGCTVDRVEVQRGRRWFVVKPS